MAYVLIFAIGLSLGSFFNVLVNRFENSEGTLTGRSQCPHCHHKLSWLDLVPVLSFIQLKGRCRYCHNYISWQYPLVELATAILCLSLYLFLPGNFIIWPILLLFFLLILYDVKFFILPDQALIVILILIAVGGLWRNHLLAGLWLSLFFAILYIASGGRWIGFGDVKLAFVVGVIMGLPFGILTTLIAIWVGAILGVALILLKKASGKTMIPFGALLALAVIVVTIFQNYFSSYARIFQ